MTTIYLAHSIYHILYSLSMINSRRDSMSYLVLFSNNKEASIIVEKLLKVKSEEKIIELIIIPSETKHKSILQKEALTKIKEIKKLDINELVTFNEDNLLAIHLGQYFHKHNIKVSLAQDGMKAYATITKMALKYRLLRSLEYFTFCRSNKFEYYPILISMRYGKSYYVNKLYVSHEDTFENYFSKDIERIDLDENILKTYALLESDTLLEYKKPTVLFISSLLKFDQAAINIEIKILNHLANAFPRHQLAIKTHPRVDEGILTYHKKNGKNWIIINNAIPAEVYLHQLEQCKLMSAFSGVALFNQSQDKGLQKFWLYPLYEDKIKSLQYTKLKIPDNSIHLVKDWEEFYKLFPLLSSENMDQKHRLNENVK